MIDFAGVANEIIEKQGISITLDGDRPIEGYMVSMSGTEVRIPVVRFAGYVVEAYVEAYSALLHVPGNHLGAWLHSVDGIDYVYLDVSVQFATFKRALVLAQREQQVAFWDVVGLREHITEDYAAVI